MRANEYCIMPEDEFWQVKRFEGSHRHEVFGGINRKRSIEDGLIIFLHPDMHNMSSKGIHFNKKFRDYTQKIGQATWQQFYGKSKEDFIKRYGKSYL